MPNTIPEISSCDTVTATIPDVEALKKIVSQNMQHSEREFSSQMQSIISLKSYSEWHTTYFKTALTEMNQKLLNSKVQVSSLKREVSRLKLALLIQMSVIALYATVSLFNLIN